MALATAAGALKHGFPHVLQGSVYAAVLWTASLSGAAAVHCAPRATVDSRASARARPWLERAAWAGTALFLSASLIEGPEVCLLVVYNAGGLLPVLAVEARAGWAGDSGGRRVGTGLTVSVLTGAVYSLELSAGRWLTHVDLAHVLMGVSFLCIVAGATDGRGERRVPLAGRAAVEVRT
jgi:hypothetical protein